MTEAILLRGVTKRFSGTAAVDDLTLTVPAGSIYGFIGPNGSGKTTTLRMIMHILLPDQGRHRGPRIRATRRRARRVSYLPEERGLYKKMTVRRAAPLLRPAERRTARRRSMPRSTNGWRAWAARAGRQADRDPVERHVAEGAVRRRGRLDAGAADPRRAVLRPRSRSTPRCSRTPCSRCAAAARRSCSAPTTCRPPSGCATASS